MALDAIYYIWGSEIYFIDRKVEELIAQQQELSHHETEVVFLDVEDMRPQEWAQELEFSPLFQLSRMVVIKRPPWLGTANKRVKDEKIIEDILERYAAAPPAGQTLILTAETKAAGNPIVKRLGKSATYIECSALTPAKTEEWLVQEAKKRHCRFENKALVKRLAGSGQNLYYLAQLLDKLAILAPDGVIQGNMLENQVEYKQEIKIFRLLDGMLERKTAYALEALQQLFRQGEAEVYILYMMNRQFLLYAQVKAMGEKGMEAADIEAALKQKPYTVKKMLERSRKYRWDEIEIGARLLLQAELDIKTTGQPPRMVLETLVVALIDADAAFLREEVF